VTLTATVSASAAVGVVTFYDNGTQIGSALVSGGVGKITTSTLAFGSHALTASYSGDSSNPAAISKVLIQKVVAASTTTLISPANPVAFGQSITLTASVSPSNATGVVTFYDGTTILGTRPLTQGGANLTTTLLAAGTHSLIARYGGDIWYSGGDSAIQLLRIGPAVVSANGFRTGPSLASALSVGTGECNADGRADLVTCTGIDVRVMLGNGDGTFQPPIITNTTGVALALGDFNGDGKPDVAVAGSSGITILLGRGDGMFQAPITYTPHADSIATGDFNGDGRIDLALADSTGTLSLLIGNGDGTFKTPVAYGGGPTGNTTSHVLVGDFNNDGRADVLIVGATQLAVMLGNGDGTLQSAIARSGHGVSAALGDFNGDGNADLALAAADPFGGGNHLLYVYSGNGDGTFREPLTRETHGLAIAAADFNGDGIVDIAAAGNVHLGFGDGTFQYYVAYQSVPGNAAAVADFNLDGRADVAIAGASVLLGASATKLAFSAQPATGIAGYPLADATVQAQDAAGNVVGTGSSVSLVSTPAGVSSGGLITSGTATFSGLLLRTAGTYTLTASSSGLASGTSTPFTISPGPAATLVVATQPSNGQVGVPLTPPVVVLIQDWSGNVITGWSGPLTLISAPAGIVSTVNAVNGVATFASLIFSSVGQYTLAASSPGLSGVTSNSFVVGSGTYSISGIITANNAPGSGVTVTLSGGLSAATTTNASGAYSFNGLTAGGTYTVTPSLTGYAFAPLSQTFTAFLGNQTANFTAIQGLQFYPVAPCRVADTRAAAGFPTPFGAPAMAASQTRTFPVRSSACGIPSNAAAYSLNFTVVPPSPGGYLGVLTTYPTGQPRPNVSTLNSYTGTVVANAAIVPAGANGSIDVYVSDKTDVLFDINGYFAPPSNSGLQFFAVSPCRVADTRPAAAFPGFFGAPTMAAGETRAFPVPSSFCGLPLDAAAYSFNFTVVPPTPGYLGLLTTWPAGTPRPNASTLNSYTGTVVANAAIVPAGNSGGVSVYVSDKTDVLFDVNGYFARPSNGLNFYPLTPCRVVDTRPAAGFPSTFGSVILESGTRTYPMPSSSCGIPADAKAYSLNFTVVPPVPNGRLGLLTTYPTGQPRPNASTLNSYTGTVVANAAIVPAGTNGSLSVYISDPTYVIIDINGFFR
jgi:hypothetical protein